MGKSRRDDMIIGKNIIHSRIPRRSVLQRNLPPARYRITLPFFSRDFVRNSICLSMNSKGDAADVSGRGC